MRRSNAHAAMTSVTRPAHAKINLYLHVTGRRPDGYHLLDSVFVYAALHDDVTVRPGSGVVIVSGPFGAALAGEDNILSRARRLFAETYGMGGDASFELVKNIPVAAGLGGGSADAAAALQALAALYEQPLTDETAQALALKLGADVPAAFCARPVRVQGIGEQLEPLAAVPDLHLVLVNPGIALSTKDVFAAYAAGGMAFSPAVPPLPSEPAAFVQALAELNNDLTPAAISLAPEIGRVLDRLAATPGCLLARMSGSGATCFGLYETAALADAAALTLAVDMGWWSWSGGLK